MAGRLLTRPGSSEVEQVNMKLRCSDDYADDDVMTVWEQSVVLLKGEKEVQRRAKAAT